MDLRLALLLAACGLGHSRSIEETNSIEGEISDIIEMVPFDRVLALAIDYAVSDQQVRRFVHYATGEHFKNNVASFETSPQFKMAAGFAERYHVNLYSIANRINHILDVPQVKFNRAKRSPGEGVLSLVKEIVQLTPLTDMKHVYRYKIDTNPRFKDFMDQLVTGNARLFLSSLAGSKPFEDTKRDLVQIGIPVDEIMRYLADSLTVFLEAHQPIQLK